MLSGSSSSTFILIFPGLWKQLANPLLACAFPELGGSLWWERCNSQRDQGQLTPHCCSKHPTPDGISRQVLAKSGLGSFPQGCPRPLDGQQGCSHMDFMPIFARCGGAMRTNVGQLYQRSVILPAICTEDAGGRGWQREGEESSLLQVSGDIPIVTGKLRRPMDAQGLTQ